MIKVFLISSATEIDLRTIHAFVLRLILFFVFQFTDCLFLVDDTGADSLDFIQCSIIYQISTYFEDVMNGIRLCFSYY